VHTNLGALLRLREDVDGAGAEYRKALDIQEGLAAADPTNVEWRREAATTRKFMGNLYFEYAKTRADAVAAVAAYAGALDAAKRMVAAAPDDAQTRAVVGYLEGRVEAAEKLLATMKDERVRHLTP
jgi:hypothetical protein